jgi:protein subunit release factor B
MDSPYLKTQSLTRIKEALARAGVDEADLDERFVVGSGAGGQKMNKTSSAVVLRHPPTQTVVKCQATRSREVNRWLARRLLVERILERTAGERSVRQQAAEKIRRQKRRRSRRQKARMLDDKREHAERKTSRKTVECEA